MDFKIGQKVSYPNHGVCAIEGIDRKQVGGTEVELYSLRVASNNSVILVPKANAHAIGIRPIISDSQCSKLLDTLSDDFLEISNDWKIRVRDYNAKIQTGNVFEATDVLKHLTFLSYSKQLSFREQRLLEKAKFLVVSELAASCCKSEFDIECEVSGLLETTCRKHLAEMPDAAQ